jgi:methylglutaconyl-CoA hydratase
MSLVTVEHVDAAISVLTLNRADKRNALSIELLEQMIAAIRQIESDRHRRALIVRGEGPSFCAGLDLKEASDPSKSDRSAHLLADMYLAVATTPLVTIAAAHGTAMGGGAGLVAACDFVVAAEDLRIAYPEVHRGLVAALVTTLMRRQLSERVLRDLTILGQTVDPIRTLQIGLVNRMCSNETLMDNALHLAHEACKGAPGAIHRTKKLLDSLSARTIEEDLKRALDFHLHARSSDEAAEGVQAFLQKRAPRWGPRPE